MTQMDRVLLICADEILTPRGWTNSEDRKKLAARLADTVQDFLADLENEEEK